MSLPKAERAFIVAAIEMKMEREEKLRKELKKRHR